MPSPDTPHGLLYAPRSPRLLQRWRNTFIIGFLAFLLVLDHFNPHLFHSEYPPSSHLAIQEPHLAHDDIHEAPAVHLPPPITTNNTVAYWDEQFANMMGQHQWAMENETLVSQFGQFADRVKVLLRSQSLYEEYEQSSAKMSDEEFEGMAEIARLFQEDQEELLATLFPYLSKSKAMRRSLADLKKGYTHDRGIIVPCGNDQFQMAVHLIATLKHVHKTPLPIHVVYAHPGDLDYQKRAAFRAISPDVDVLDIVNFFDEEEVGLTWGGWAIKAFAILASPFREVIIVDADAVFLQPPEVLFEFPQYKETGTLYFHDREIFPGEGDVHRWWKFQMEGKTPSSEMAKSKFWNDARSREEMESGVVVYDKGRREVLMGIIMTGWMNTKTVRDMVTYKITHGDKESFWMAFELIGIPYSFDSAEYAAMIGQLTHPDGASHSVHSAICSDHILHLDWKKKPLWFNGSLFQEKEFRAKKGFFFATHWAPGTADWECDPHPWCMVSMREVDVHKITEDNMDRVLTDMIGAALYWEGQFPTLIPKPES